MLQQSLPSFRKQNSYTTDIVPQCALLCANFKVHIWQLTTF
jgi:hypothetical protein